MRDINSFLKSISKALAFFLASAVLFVGCEGVKVESTPDFTPPGDYSLGFSLMVPSNVMELSESKHLVTDSVSGAIARANYFPGKNTLLAVSTGDGLLRAWDVDDATVLFEHDLGIVSSVGLGFDESGDLVVGGMLHEIIENDYGELVEHVGGVAIWETDTGGLVKCIVHPCGRSSSEWQRDALPGVVLDPKGRWVIVFNELYIKVSDLTARETSYSFTEGYPGNLKHVAQIAFDFTGDRYALAIREGEIIIEEVGKEVTWFSPKIRLGTYKERDRHEITGLSFSPDGKWLARIQDDILEVWRINARRGKLHFEHNIPNGHLLAFDRSSELLFVGTQETIEIWSTTEMKLIGELATPEITSLSISADNRLLIWGDQLGIVHVWGIR